MSVGKISARLEFPVVVKLINSAVINSKVAYPSTPSYPIPYRVSGYVEISVAVGISVPGSRGPCNCAIAAMFLFAAYEVWPSE